MAKPKKVRNRSGPSFSDCHRESNRHFRCWEFKFQYWQKLPATKHADWTRCAFSAYARGRENTETAGTDRSKCHFCCLLMLVLRALLTRPFSCIGSERKRKSAELTDFAENWNFKTEKTETNGVKKVEWLCHVFVPPADNWHFLAFLGRKSWTYLWTQQQTERYISLPVKVIFGF